jgi:hypothetical protein
MTFLKNFGGGFDRAFTKKDDSTESPFQRIMKKGRQSYGALAAYKSRLKYNKTYF